MTDDSRIIWSYTENHLRQWMAAMHQDYGDSETFRFPDPDPDSLTEAQVAELYRRINATIENSDGPLQDIPQFAWMIMQDMGLAGQP